MGEFVAYRADNGERLWSMQTQAGVLAAPISYAVDGEQYIAIEVGWGGAFGLAAGELARDSHVASNLPRVLVFKLGGAASLPALPAVPQAALHPPVESAGADLVAGKGLLDGTRTDRGMVAFRAAIAPADLDNIRAYLIHRAIDSATAKP